MIFGEAPMEWVWKSDICREEVLMRGKYCSLECLHLAHGADLDLRHQEPDSALIPSNQ